MPDPIAQAFPRRPLRLTAPIETWRAWIVGILGALLFGGAFAAMSFEAIPGLISDHEIRATAQPMPKTRIQSGRCKVRLLLLNDCEVTLSVPQDRGAPVRRTVHYLFVEPSFGNRDAMAMGDPARPELATTDLGLDRFWNRVMTLGGMLAVSAALALGCLMLPILAGRQKRALARLSRVQLEPVPARVQMAQRVWNVTPVGGGKVSKWNLGSKGEPFVMDPAGGIVLAVSPVGGGDVFPLDEKLQWIELTDAERAALRVARDTIQGRGGDATVRAAP
ncbi:hypothetical protein [Roseococcus sp. YIM B11640]|uniref:hypothetical protein n=1 Tax=Roseococcus sp. YIM B11640 TaxID=3133973 RepID=UPI003C7EC8D9